MKRETEGGKMVPRTGKSLIKDDEISGKREGEENNEEYIFLLRKHR